MTQQWSHRSESLDMKIAARLTHTHVPLLYLALVNSCGCALLGFGVLVDFQAFVKKWIRTHVFCKRSLMCVKIVHSTQINVYNLFIYFKYTCKSCISFKTSYFENQAHIHYISSLPTHSPEWYDDVYSCLNQVTVKPWHRPTLISRLLLKLWYSHESMGDAQSSRMALACSDKSSDLSTISISWSKSFEESHKPRKPCFMIAAAAAT